MSNYQIGMALADLRLAQKALLQSDTTLAQLTEQLSSLVRREEEIRAKPEDGAEYRELTEKIELSRRDISLLRTEAAERQRLRRNAFERADRFPDLHGQLDGLDDSDLESLSAHYIQHDTALGSRGDDCRRLIEILEEWKDRFGRSSDFHSAYVIGSDVIAGTCVGLATRSLQQVEFDLCIIDEASKATPTEILVPLSRSRRWIIVGDPQQLPPFVGDAVENPQILEKHGLAYDDVKETLLDHLLSRLSEHSKLSLLRQHRMIRPIGDLISHCFYGGRLINVNQSIDDRFIRAQAMPKPVTWFSTSRRETRREHKTRNGYRNFAEIEIIERLLHRIHFAAQLNKITYSVCLLSGYAGQVYELRRLAAGLSAQLSSLQLEASTVDAYQGREADIAVYSVVRSNEHGEIGFLKERERLNVALSRPRVGLAIVGDSNFCDSVHGLNPFRDVLSYIRQHPGDCAIAELTS